MPSNLALFLELKGNTKTDCGVTPLPHVSEYIYIFSAVRVGEKLGASMCFKGPSRSQACQKGNSGSRLPQASKWESIQPCSGKQFLCRFCLVCRHSSSPSLHYQRFTIFLGGDNMKQRIHSESAREVAILGVKVCKYLELNQECQSAPGLKYD